MSSQKIKLEIKKLIKKNSIDLNNLFFLNSEDLSKIVSSKLFLVNGKLVIRNINIFADI